MASPSATVEEENNGLDDDVFYALGLDRVWHDDGGNWIPDEHRYHGDENQIMDWYSYCQVHHINWGFPQLLPNWAIEDMDQYYRDLYKDHLSEHN